MDNFHQVAWNTESNLPAPPNYQTEAQDSSSRPGANGKRRSGLMQAGPAADAVDLAGIGEGVIECIVDSPLKENDGSKDAYVSYQVTTNVGNPSKFPIPLPGLNSY